MSIDVENNHRPEEHLAGEAQNHPHHHPEELGHFVDHHDHSEEGDHGPACECPLHNHHGDHADHGHDHHHKETHSTSAEHDHHVCDAHCEHHNHHGDHADHGHDHHHKETHSTSAEHNHHVCDAHCEHHNHHGDHADHGHDHHKHERSFDKQEQADSMHDLDAAAFQEAVANMQQQERVAQAEQLEKEIKGQVEQANQDEFLKPTINSKTSQTEVSLPVQQDEMLFQAEISVQNIELPDMKTSDTKNNIPQAGDDITETIEQIDNELERAEDMSVEVESSFFDESSHAGSLTEADAIVQGTTNEQILEQSDQVLDTIESSNTGLHSLTESEGSGSTDAITAVKYESSSGQDLPSLQEPEEESPTEAVTISMPSPIVELLSLEQSNSMPTERIVLQEADLDELSFEATNLLQELVSHQELTRPEVTTKLIDLASRITQVRSLELEKKILAMDATQRLEFLRYIERLKHEEFAQEFLRSGSSGYTRPYRGKAALVSTFLLKVVFGKTAQQIAA